MGNKTQKLKISFDLLSVGNITLDQVCKVDRIPHIEETALILHQKLHFGGRGANVAFTSARLGLSVALASIAGRDFIGSGYRDFLLRNGINIDKVKVVRKKKSANIRLFYTDKTDMNYFFQPLISDSSSPLGLTEDYLKSCRVVYATPFDGNREVLNVLSMSKRQANTIVIALGEEVYRKSAKFLENAVDAAHYLFINRAELESLMERGGFSGMRDIFTKHRDLICVSMTMGHLGSMLYTKDSSYRIPPVSAYPIVNSLGAGDAYVAGFIYGLLKRSDLETCGKIASVVASFVLQEEGAQSPKISIDEVQKRYSKVFGNRLQ